jgi:tRNA-binding EMAP/Myf-like protein
MISLNGYARWNDNRSIKMPKANKFLILKVDTGIDVRTIVSGIAEF